MFMQEVFDEIYLLIQILIYLYVVLYVIKTKPIGMCIDIPMANSKPIGSRFHKEFPQQGSSFLRIVHLVIILLRHVRYNKDWGTLANSEPQNTVTTNEA